MTARRVTFSSLGLRMYVSSRLKSIWAGGDAAHHGVRIYVSGAAC